MDYEFCFTVFISGSTSQQSYSSCASQLKSMSDKLLSMEELMQSAIKELSILKTKIELERTVCSQTTVVASTVLSELQKLSARPNKHIIISFHQQRLSDSFKACDTSRRQVVGFISEATNNILALTSKLNYMCTVLEGEGRVTSTKIDILHDSILNTSCYHDKAFDNLENVKKLFLKYYISTPYSTGKLWENFHTKYEELRFEFLEEKSQAEKLCKAGKEIRVGTLLARQYISANGERILNIALKVMEGTVYDVIYNYYRLDLKRCSHVGFLYCSDCEEEFSYPAEEKLHPGHHYYETQQASIHKKVKEVAKEMSQCRLDPAMAYCLEKYESTLNVCKVFHSFTPKHFRIASWNVHRLSDQSKNQDLFMKRLRCICRTILYYKIDVIALQEVCSCETLEQMMIHTLRYYSRLEWTSIKKQVEREHFFIVYHEECFDVVKKPIVESTSPNVVSQNNVFPKAIVLRMTLDDGSWLTIINTHLTFENEGIRKQELASLTKITQPDEPPTILLGDFNTGPKELADNLGDSYHCIFEEGEKTNTLETKSYDNIIVAPRHRETVHHFVGSIISGGELTKVEVSDHLPIIADLNFSYLRR